MNINKGFLFLFGFVVVVLAISFTISHHYKKIDFSKEVYFEVSEVRTSSALRSTLYDYQGNTFALTSYTFFERHNIKEGDIIRKEANSEVLRVYRKDSLVC